MDSSFLFRRFCNFLYGREWIYAGENPVASYEAGYGVGNAISGHDPEVVLFFFFRKFYKSYYGEEVSSVGGAQPEMVEVIGSSPIQPL